MVDIGIQNQRGGTIRIANTFATVKNVDKELSGIAVTNLTSGSTLYISDVDFAIAPGHLANTENLHTYMTWGGVATTARLTGSNGVISRTWEVPLKFTGDGSSDLKFYAKTDNGTAGTVYGSYHGIVE